jgi:hypothetical protein
VGRSLRFSFLLLLCKRWGVEIDDMSRKIQHDREEHKHCLCITNSSPSGEGRNNKRMIYLYYGLFVFFLQDYAPCLCRFRVFRLSLAPASCGRREETFPRLEMFMLIVL